MLDRSVTSMARSASLNDREEIGFLDAVQASFGLQPTRRLLDGLYESAGTGLAVVAPTWLGGISVDELDEASPSGPPKPFNYDEYSKRLSEPQKLMGDRLKQQGNLSDVLTEQQFHTVLSDAMSVQQDMETVTAYQDQSGFIKSLAASAVAGFGDPIFMIPVGTGVGAGALVTGALARQLAVKGAVTAAGFSAISLGSKKVVDATSYDLTNEPGMGDELVVAGIGAGLGMVMPAAGYFAKDAVARTVSAAGRLSVRVPGPLPAWARRWNSQRKIQLFHARMPQMPIQRRAMQAAGEGADAALRPISGTQTMAAERTDGKAMLERILRQATKKKPDDRVFLEDLSLAPLRNGGEDKEIDDLISKIKKAYERERNRMRSHAKKGKTPRHDPAALNPTIVEHPSQTLMDQVYVAQQLGSINVDRIPLKARGRVLSLLADIGDRWSVTGGTPSSRMRRQVSADATKSWTTSIVDIYSTLVANMNEPTPAAIGLAGTPSASAEATKEMAMARLISVHNEMLNALKGAGHVKYGYVTRSGRDLLEQAVNIIDDRRNLAAGVPNRSVAAPDPVAVRLADMIDGWYKSRYDELVAENMFIDDPFAMRDYINLVFDVPSIKADRTNAERAFIEQFKLVNAAKFRGTIRPDVLADVFDRNKKNDAIRSEVVDVLRAHLSDPAFDPKNGREILDRLNDPALVSTSGAFSFLPDISTLKPALATAYADTQQQVYERSAKDLLDRIINPKNGIATADATARKSTPSPFKERSFQVLAPEIRKFVVRDPIRLMGAYHSTIDGHIAISKAIRRNPEVYAKLRYKDSAGEWKTVTDSNSLIDWITEQRKTMGIVASEMSRNTAVANESADAIRATVALDRQFKDLDHAINSLVGKTLRPGEFLSDKFMLFSSRNLLRLSYLAHGGMMGVTNALDYNAVIAWQFGQGTGLFKHLYGMVSPFSAGKSYRASRRAMLEELNMMTQMSWLTRDFGEYNLAERGFGDSPTTQRVSGTVDSTMELAQRKYGQINGMNITNDLRARAGAVTAWFETLKNARILYRAMRSNGTAQAIEKSGLTRNQLAGLSRVGVRLDNLEGFLRNTHANGAEWDGRASSFRSFDEFVDGDYPVNPQMDRWSGDDASELADVMSTQLRNEAMRVYGVTPSIGDRPRIEQEIPIVRVINQFTSFLRATNQQRLRTVVHGTAAERTRYIVTTLAMGWLFKATMDEITKRKSFDESMAQLVENPAAAALGAVQMSGAWGNIGRLMGVLDSFDVGPMQLAGLDVAGGTTGHMMRQRFDRDVGLPERTFSMLGPVAQDASKLFGSFQTDDERRADYMRYSTLPFSNWIGARVLNRFGVSDAVNDRIGPVPFIVPYDTLRPARKSSFRMERLGSR